MVLPSRVVGLAMRAERKVIDKIIDGLKFHASGPLNSIGEWAV